MALPPINSMAEGRAGCDDGGNGFGGGNNHQGAFRTYDQAGEVIADHAFTGMNANMNDFARAGNGA